MRIGVDVKCLRSNNSGIGRYVVGLLRALGRIDSANDYVLFSPRETGLDAPGPRFRQVVSPRGSLWEKAPGILWQQIALPGLLAKEKIDVFWGPEQTLPLFPVQREFRLPPQQGLALPSGLRRYGAEAEQ